MIHPTAIVDRGAVLGREVEVGPFTVIEEGVVIGEGCRLGPQVQIRKGTTLGSFNQIHAGCVLGDDPQDKSYKQEPTRLVIGDHNVFREHFTAHRSNQPAEETVIGSHNYFMALSHVGHNARVGNHVVVANGALLGGHVSVADRAFISGHCLVHQFVRVGTLALMQGGSAISKDLPPYTVARGDNGICGLNVIGLRRAGFTAAQRLELKRIYRLLFRRAGSLAESVAAARERFASSEAAVLFDFIATSRRGVCVEKGEGKNQKAEGEAENE